MSNLCVSCGAEIPEGRQVCQECMTKFWNDSEEADEELRRNSDG